MVCDGVPERDVWRLGVPDAHPTVEFTGQPRLSKTDDPAADCHFSVNIGKNFCCENRFFGPKMAISKKLLKFGNFVINISGVIIAVGYE
jgi:hypothetical protein